MRTRSLVGRVGLQPKNHVATLGFCAVLCTAIEINAPYCLLTDRESHDSSSLSLRSEDGATPRPPSLALHPSIHPSLIQGVWLAAVVGRLTRHAARLPEG